MDGSCNYDASTSATGDVTNESDNCSTGLNATYADATAPGSTPSSVIITRTWSLVDNCGNAAANQVQTITVVDNTAPTVTAPANISVNTDAGQCYATVAALGTPVTGDNCGVATVTDNRAANNQYVIGTHTITWTVVDINGNTSTATQTIEVINTLPALGEIIGTDTACVAYAAGSTTFSVAPVSDGINPTTYTWTVPTGMTIVSGQGTNSITVSWTSITVDPTIKGTLSVIAQSVCASRTASTYVVYSSTAPVTPPSISGPTRLCPGDNGTYSIALVSRASSYTWTAPAGVTITSGQGTNVINVLVGAGYTGGNFTVSAVNTCGASPVRTRSTVLNTPATPGAISGQSAGVCGSTITYSIAAVSGANSYSWSVSGGTINGSNSGSSVSVTWDGTGASGSIAVASVNNCGSSSARSLTISKSPARPGTITGTTTPCGGTTQAYGVTTVAGASSYVWTVTAGGAIASGAGTKDVTISWSTGVTIAQTVTVRTVNSCGTSTNRTATVNIQSCPREAMEVGTILSMTAFPNPANDFVNIHFETANVAEYAVRLMDMSGRTISNETGESTQGLNQVTFGVGELSSGVYFIVLDHDGNRQTLRLMVE